MKFVAPKPAPRGFARRVPPAIFPPILGLFALGLGWRRAMIVLDLPRQIPETALGAITLLFVFSFVAYMAKLILRPMVLREELRLMAGRLGLSAMIAGLYFLAMTLSPYLPDPARWLLSAALVLHAGLIVLILGTFARGPAEARRYSPAGQLYFVSPIIGAAAAADLGPAHLALGLLAGALAVAIALWLRGADRLWRRGLAAPLRPLLALHLMPAGVAGLAALSLGQEGVAEVFASVAALMLAAGVLGGRWLTRSGFTALWGAFTFPLAATASLWIDLGGMWRMAGSVLLVGATFVTLPIAFRVLKLWAGGQLAVKTNAAIA